MGNKSNFWFGLFLLLTILLTLFSYTQVDLNLTLDQNPVYLSLQQQATWLGYFQRTWSTAIFVVLTLSLSFVYLQNIRLAVKRDGRKWLARLGVLACILVLGYPLFPTIFLITFLMPKWSGSTRRILTFRWRPTFLKIYG